MVKQFALLQSLSPGVHDVLFMSMSLNQLDDNLLLLITVLHHPICSLIWLSVSPPFPPGAPIINQAVFRVILLVIIPTQLTVNCLTQLAISPIISHDIMATGSDFERWFPSLGSNRSHHHLSKAMVYLLEMAASFPINHGYSMVKCRCHHAHITSCLTIIVIDYPPRLTIINGCNLYSWQHYPLPSINHKFNHSL